jgi:exodeoxyribonuclease-5
LTSYGCKENTFILISSFTVLRICFSYYIILKPRIGGLKLDIILNSQQSVAVDKACGWYNDFRKNHFNVRPYFEISGPAGSGKTTIVRTITERLGFYPEQVMYMALVGKATLALVRNGVPAKTIHSSIYEYKAVPRVDESKGPITDARGKPIFDMGFVLKEILSNDVRLLVVDEGAMVSTTIAQDLLSFGIPIIVLGDLNQLPPVFGKSFFLSRPDVILTEIMRQALDNPIIALSQHVLKNGHKNEH